MWYIVVEVINLSSVFGFRLPDDLRKYIESQAKKNRCSLGHYIVMLIVKDMEQNRSVDDGNN